MLYPSLLVTALLVLVEVYGTDLKFYIRHKLSGYPVGVYPETPGDRMSLHLISVGDNSFSDCCWSFESVDGEWGYLINHGATKLGKSVYPTSKSMTPSDQTQLMIQDDGHPYSLFALDQINNRIIHHGGKYLHPEGDQPEPPHWSLVVLSGDVNEAMEYELTKTNDPDEIVYPYGDATIAGDWVLVFSVENPLATHTYSVTASIGKSESMSTSSSFQFIWEGSAGVQAIFAHMSSSTTLSKQIEQSSAQTWTAEITTTNTIVVEAGKSVATWQKHFYGEQLGHKAVHQSNMFIDTEGPGDKPVDDVNAEYYFI